MNVIDIVTVGEPLPFDGRPRLLRSVLLANALVTKGWRVRYWTSRFDHFSKAQRRHLQPTESLNGVEYRFVDAYGYPRNISVRRLLHNSLLARSFRRDYRTSSPAALALASMPTIDMASEVVAASVARGVPAVVDVRDAWPDAIVNLAPAPLRPASRLMFGAAERRLRRAVGSASALSASSKAMLAWALSKANREASCDDRYFHHGYPALAVRGGSSNAATMWSERLQLREGDVVAMFAGTISRLIDAPALAEGIRNAVLQSGGRLKVVVCGDGESRHSLIERVGISTQVHFPGWVSADEIAGLLQVAHLGILPYPNSFNFLLGVPNKIGEYLSGGLAVVSSLRGEAERVLARLGCGRTYQQGSGEDLARVLTELVKDADQLNRLRAKAREAFASEFHADAVYERFAEWLSTLATRKP